MLESVRRSLKTDDDYDQVRGSESRTASGISGISGISAPIRIEMTFE